jgi:hypothetical protein
MAWVQAWPTTSVSPAAAVAQWQANNLWIQQFAEVDHDFLGSSGGMPLGLHKKASFEDAVADPAIPTSALGVLYALTNNGSNRLYWRSSASSIREMVLCEQGTTTLAVNSPNGGLQNLFDFTGYNNVAGLFIAWRPDATQWCIAAPFVFTTANNLTCINGNIDQAGSASGSPTKVSQAWSSHWWDGNAINGSAGYRFLTGLTSVGGTTKDNIMKVYCVQDIIADLQWMWFGVNISV